MDVLTEVQLKKIKEFYTTKKEKYYAGNRYRQYEYTPFLDTPYTEEEINTFEEKYNVNLDPNLKLYLLKVSREIFVTPHPNIFDLCVERSCFIPENKSLWSNGECYIHGHYLKCICENKEVINDMLNGMCRIGDGGCSNADYIVVKGTNYGTIWDSDGDSVFKKYHTFKQYIIPRDD